MQEYGWLHGNDFRTMLGVIGRQPDARKIRLAACACARRAWDVLEDPRLRAAVETAEQFADFQVKKERLKAVRRLLAEVVEEARQQLVRDKDSLPGWVQSDPRGAAAWARYAADGLPIARAAGIVESVVNPRDIPADSLNWLTESLWRLAPPDQRDRLGDPPRLCALLRDIFGNPFRPVAFSPDWRTGTAVSLARQMYESRDFTAIPILADALQDAGCEHPDILAHCHDPNGTHVRGCWVVDLVLGKS